MTKVIQLGNPLLRKKSKRVPLKKIESKEIQSVIKRIISVMKAIKKTSATHGNGLCAPQVGSSYQIVVVYFDKKHHVLINPTITKKSKKLFKNSEGCLSYFYLRGYVKRHEMIVLSAYDQNGEKVEYTFREGLAGLVQHEIDHVHGILFLDRIKDMKSIFSIDEFYKSKPGKIAKIKKIIKLIT